MMPCMLGAPWYVVPVAALTTVVAATLLQQRSNRRRLEADGGARFVQDAAAVVAALERMGQSADGGRRVSLYVNSLKEELHLPYRHLRAAVPELPTLFDSYALACVSTTVSNEMKADVWNTLLAVLEVSLSLYVEADPLTINSGAAAASLALCSLLSGRYHLARLVPHVAASSLYIRRVPRELFTEALQRNKRDGSTLHSLAAFIQLVRASCSRQEQLLLGALALVSIGNLLHVYVRTTLPMATPACTLYAANVLSVLSETTGAAPVSCKALLAHVVAAAPGKLLAAATLGTLFSHLVTAAKDAASDGLMRRLRVATKTDTLLALARFDFVADAAWRVPHRVYAALSVVTNFSVADADRLLSLGFEGAQRCRAAIGAPLPCLVGWMTRQCTHYLQRAWTRACLMRSFVDAAVASPATAVHGNDGGPSHLSRYRVPSAAPLMPNTHRAHYGLQILLLAMVDPMPRAVTSAVEVLARHTRWPLLPLSSLRGTRRALGGLCAGGLVTLRTACNAAIALADDAADHGAAPSLTARTPGTPLAPFASLLSMLRSQGDAWVPSSGAPLSPAGDEWFFSAPTAREEVVDKILSTLDGLPLMAALAVRARQAGTLVSGDVDCAAVETAFQVTRAVESADVFPMPPVRPWASVSAFQFDVEVAQLRFHEHEGYAQSIAAVLFVQSGHRPVIDRSPVLREPPPLLAFLESDPTPWRIEFEHVCFRYPGSDVDVLHDISFAVPAGGFLGIVGFSGAGKSTVLHLLSRLYAPTSGTISINGRPIADIPPRALRRRLGISWQGDGSGRFLEGLSVARNVAYGALQRANTSVISDALAAACVADAVAGRPRGLEEALQLHEWSGGEVERLSVARALMVAPAEAGAYLFDECTSGLDSVTEAAVFARGLRAGRRVTQLMVSHRLSSVQDADEIIVLAGGRIVERGTWQQLLRSAEDSLFQTLHRAQVLG